MEIPTSLDNTGVAYLQEPTVEVVVGDKTTRVRIRRERPTYNRKFKSPTKRGKITEFSVASWFKAKEHLENATCYVAHLTLTLPDDVKDNAIVRKSLERFFAYLLGRDCSCFWKQEFQLSGRPHLHLLLTKWMELEDLRLAWMKACRSDVLPQVTLEPIKDYPRLCRYILKSVDDPSNQVPDGYRNCGRRWGTRGPDAKPTVHLRLVGPRSEVLQQIRALRALDKAAKRKRNPRVKPKKDRGISGRRYGDVGGKSVADALNRLAGPE